MRGTRVLGAIVATLTATCSTAGIGRGPTISPPTPDASPTPTISASPTGSPGTEGSLEIGGASITVSGDLTADVSLPTLSGPAVWEPPPGPMDLTWDEPGGQTLSLSGTSFASRAATNDDRVLSFVFEGPDAPVEFTSRTGECSITITPALPDNMGGVFSCTALTDVDGTFTVDAHGTFSATG